MARRGWIEKKDVINTLGLEEMLSGLRAKPGCAPQKTAQKTAAVKPLTAKARKTK
jgi:hypothetical protein